MQIVEKPKHVYSDQLERVYRLCTRCQGVLNKTLMKKQELYMSNLQQPFKPLDQPQVSFIFHGPEHRVSKVLDNFDVLIIQIVLAIQSLIVKWM